MDFEGEILLITNAGRRSIETHKINVHKFKITPSNIPKSTGT